MEGLPSPCSPVAFAGGYAKKHDPFMYYDDVAADPRRCRNVVPFGRLGGDLRRSAAAGFRLHLARPVPRHPRLRGRHRRPLPRRRSSRGCCASSGRTASSSSPGTRAARARGCCTDAHGGRIATIVAGPGRRRGVRSARPVDHYGVLRTVEMRSGSAAGRRRAAAQRDARRSPRARARVALSVRPARPRSARRARSGAAARARGRAPPAARRRRRSTPGRRWFSQVTALP